MLRKAVVLILGLFLSGVVLADGADRPEDKVPGIADAPPGGDFALHSSKGPFNLKDLRGKVVLLYFGYTKCPDVCPTSLSLMTQALNELTEEELDRVQGVFVGVDPKRDTFEAMDEYLAYFHPNLMGVTGTPEELSRAAALYGARYYEVELKGSAFGYAVNHSAATYLVAPDGKLRFIFPHETQPAIILEAIRYLLAGN